MELLALLPAWLDVCRGWLTMMVLAQEVRGAVVVYAPWLVVQGCHREVLRETLVGWVLAQSDAVVASVLATHLEVTIRSDQPGSK